MKALTILYSFLGGAVVGCGAALLLAPEKGSDVRRRICDILKRREICVSDAEEDELVAELSAAAERD